MTSWEGYEPHCGLLEAIVDFLKEHYEVEISIESFDLKRLPLHLQMRFAVVDDRGKVVGAGRDLVELQEAWQQGEGLVQKGLERQIPAQGHA